MRRAASILDGRIGKKALRTTAAVIAVARELPSRVGRRLRDQPNVKNREADVMRAMLRLLRPTPNAIGHRTAIISRLGLAVEETPPHRNPYEFELVPSITYCELSKRPHKRRRRAPIVRYVRAAKAAPLCSGNRHSA